MFMTAVPVSDLLPGDIITTDADDIVVGSIEIIPDGGLPKQPTLVRIYGVIQRGHGRSPKVQRWTRGAAETVDIERPAP